MKAVIGPAAEMEARDRRSPIASAHTIHVMVPAAAPAIKRKPINIQKMDMNTEARLASRNTTAAIRSSRPDGDRNFGSTKLKTAKADTWATDMRPAEPSETA